MPRMILPVTLLLAGCQSTAGGTAPPGQDGAAAGDAAAAPGLATCDLTKVQGHVGHPFTAPMAAQIQQQARAGSVRVIRPGQPVTMDYRTDRLNIELDAQDRIVRLRCG